MSWRQAIAKIAIKVALALLESKFKKTEVAVEIVKEVLDAHDSSKTVP